MSSPTFVPLNTGDTADDDGQVIDSLLEETNAPPTPLIEPIREPEPVPAKVPGRMLTGNTTIDPSWSGATLLLPSDINRTRLHIRAHGTAVDAYVRVAGDPGELSMGGRLYGGDDQPWDGYTGPVLIDCVGAAPVNVSWWAVTS